MNTSQRITATVMAIILILVLGAQSAAALPAGSGSPRASAQQADEKIRKEATAVRGQPAEINRQPKPVPSEPADPSRVPNLDSPTAAPDPEKVAPPEEPPTREAPDRSWWSILMQENFEGTFPTGSWDVFDNNGATYGEYYWDDDDYLPYSGGWSAWPANGGANGVDPASYYYPNNMNAWMVYGPFDLSNCASADFDFYYWNQSEPNYDFFQVMTSSDGANFGGWEESGDSGGWQYEDFSLNYHLGDDSVWLSFMFTSDGSNYDDGAFVDDITLWCLHEDNVKWWTMMVYLDGDNSLEAAAVDDFLEMSTISSNANVNVVVEMDRISGGTTAYGDWTDTRRFIISPGMTPTTANSVGIGERNMGSAETLLQFIRWAKAVAPANRYALVFWDHGSGWKLRDATSPPTKGVAFDDSSGGDAIDMPELRSVLNTTTGGGATPFDIVGLDACLMAMAEIDNQIRPYANIRASSEETEPADGWPYNLILPRLVANPSMSATTLATYIVDDYYSSYGNNQTQSAVDLGSPYSTLNTAVNNLADALIGYGGNYIDEIQAARNQATDFYDPSYIDLWDFADWIRVYVPEPTINAAATAAENAALAAVIHEHSGASWPYATGISIYFPTTSGAYDSRYDGSSGFLQFTANTHWDEWIHAYHTFVNYPAMFNKSGPANGATGQSLTPTLGWGSSSGATGYYYCFDTTNNSTCNTSWTSVGGATSGTPSLSEATTYYWQAAATNNYGAVFANHGTWWSFTTGSLPAAFNKSGPANGATNQPLNPTLTWAASSGATSYEYCYDTTNDNACSGWASNGASTSKALSGLSQNTTYYWHVRSLNGIGARYSNGSSTAFWSFTTGGAPGTFNKSSPSNGASSQSLSPTLSWGSSSNAASYEYCYDTNNNNACDGSWTNAGTNTSAGISGLSLGTTYYWHVHANNSFGETYSNSNTWWSFTTGNIPGTFGKSGPSNGATSQPLSLNLTWGSSSNASDYEYCIDNVNNSGCDASWINNGSGTNVSISGLALGTTYYWQVRANNSFGPRYADSSAWWSFTTGNVPAAFNKSGPSSGATNQPLNPTLSWGTSTGATGYEYCYDTVSNSTCEGSWTSNGSSTSVPLSGLSLNTTYYWQVRASNAFGPRYADGSAWWSFTTGNIPGAFNKASPANAASNRPLSLTLTWSVSSNASSYEYCYDTSDDSACSGWTDNGASTSAGIGGLSPSTTYYWHVRSNNSFGPRYSNGDAWWSFTTGSLPGAFNKSGPANGAINQPLSLTLNWAGAAGATSYSYCYDTIDNSACDGSWIGNGSSIGAAISGLSGDTTYYWQVKAGNAIGETMGNGGAWWSFTTGSTPGAFGKVSPSDGAIDLAPASSLWWGTAANAASYEYCFDTSNDGACGSSWTSAGLNTTIDPAGIFPPGTSYYWQVRAVNSFGPTYADGGTWWSFTTVPAVTLNAISKGAQDGWVLESSELSGIGGTMNSVLGTFSVGDDATRKQYRAVLSFDTSGLSDTAAITSVTLKVKKAGGTGNPFATLGNIAVDVRTGYFGTMGGLQLGDFKATPSKTAAMTIKNLPVGGWYSASLKLADFVLVNRNGLTQFRLRFTKDDDNDTIADVLKFYSGNAATAGYRPVLIIKYYEP